MSRRPRLRAGRGHHRHRRGRAPRPSRSPPRPTSTRAGRSSRTSPSRSTSRSSPSPIVARDQLAGALNVRTREPREFRPDEVELLQAIASQVAQSIVHAKLYADAQRRVAELEALAQISEAVSESLYLEESLEAVVKTTMDAVQATGAALVLEDGRIAWPEGRPGKHAVRTPLRWKRARDRRARRGPRRPVHR